MATSFGALCNDFFVNQKLALKMDLPTERETILHLFDSVKRVIPNMNRFRRYEGELALESSRREVEYRWLALRQHSVRSGHVNPDDMAAAAKFHDLVIELCPHHLTISPLDVDHVEVLFGFDLECKEDHDAVVYEALFADSPLGALLDVPEATALDMQPVFGLSLARQGELQAYFEVKTRTKTRRGSGKRYKDEPISLFLTLRRYGPIDSMDELRDVGRTLFEQAESLAGEKLLPLLLTPISRRIAAGSA